LSKKYEFDINNIQEKYEFDKVAKQASGSVLLTSGRSVLIATVAIDEQNPIDGDFVPLAVQYVEKAYAGAKIPGGFIKREARASEFETLTSRIIDRSIRPLFPKGYNYNTVVNVIVLSADINSDLQSLALRAVNMALFSSDIPINEHIYGLRIGKIDDNIILNPTMQELENSSLDLFVSGKDDEILMIEMMAKKTQIQDDEQIKDLANEVSEEELISIISKAKDAIKNATDTYNKEIPLNTNLLDLKYEAKSINKDIVSIINTKYKENIKDAITFMASSERSSKLNDIAKDILANTGLEDVSKEDILLALDSVKRDMLRDKIINENIRPDGRGLKDIRNITIETNILPNAHSSCLFTRGQTQSLTVLTIGSEKDSQMYETLTSKNVKYDNFMLHYNFPSFSVGEASLLSAPGRREIGHGNLAKRALLSNLPTLKNKSIRIVSEILESNGSSSMATVCASSMALYSAKIDSANLVAGIAMGLISQDGKFAVLSDISGLEDHDGDMDFKICGSKNGISALQMDLKIGGLELSLLQEAFLQAKEGREHILNLMNKATTNILYNDILPTQSSFFVPSDKIVAIIGQGGKTIKEIISKFNINIDLDRDNGEVNLSSTNIKDIEDATVYIKEIVKNAVTYGANKITYKAGDRLKGKVKKITDFGAFIGLPSGDDGLLHISKISNTKIDKVEDILSVDEEIEVIVLEVDNKRISLASTTYQS
jgi:polyribonucleotide nucleotidyltransferase